jgi:hypothetical protein
MRHLIAICGGLLLLLPGCKKSEALTPVSGLVSFRGRPLMGGTIVFTPDPERGGTGPMAYGEIGSDGRYSLHTGADAGAVSGWHRITIAASAQIPAEPAALPAKYQDPEQSGQRAEVKPGHSNTIDLNLE